MGSNGASEITLPGNAKLESPETTVEIKIKTLDSHTYTLRVNKCVSHLIKNINYFDNNYVNHFTFASKLYEC